MNYNQTIKSNQDWTYTNCSKILKNVEDNFPYTPRDMQLEVTSEIVDAIDKGYKFIILEAEAGFGKSAIAATLTKLFDSSYILTPTKQLQNQYLKEFNDFNFALIKGRNAYMCSYALDHGEICNCDEGYCLDDSSLKCHYKESNSCEYIKSRIKAANSKTVITNYDYFYFEQNVNTYSDNFFKRDLLILDEAHKIRGKMAKHLTIELDLDDLKDDTGFDIKDSDLELFNENIMIIVDELINRYETLKFKSNNSPISYDNNGRINLNNSSNFNNLNLKNLRIIKSRLEDNYGFIVSIDNEEDTLNFTPSDINCFANDVLLKYADVCIFMSATILNKDLFIKELGLDEEKVYAIRVNNTFKPERNPIVVFDNIIMNSSYSLERYNSNLEKAIETIELILEMHKNQKGIIHTISYSNANYILNNIHNDRIIGHDANNRMNVINEFKNSSEPLVLVSPSLDEGIDFPNDECRFQIILKVPFVPYDKYGSDDIKKWYDATIKFIELHGRGLRSPTDYCTTYITDCRLKNFIVHDSNDDERHFFPNFIKEAIKYGDMLFEEKFLKMLDKD